MTSTRGRPFQPGETGNPAGRPKGSRNRTTLALEQLLDGEGEAITRKAVELALDGDQQALRMCLDRLLPPRRDRPVSFEMPTLKTAADAVTAMASLTNAVAAGELTPAEAADLSRLVTDFGRVIEVRELAERLARLEVAVPAATRS